MKLFHVHFHFAPRFNKFMILFFSTNFLIYFLCVKFLVLNTVDFYAAMRLLRIALVIIMVFFLLIRDLPAIFGSLYLSQIAR